MTSGKSVNRFFLILIGIYIGATLLLGILPIELPMNVGLVISQALIFVPALCYCFIKKISIKELIPFKKMKISVWILIVIATYLMYPLLIVLNAITLVFVESGTAEMITTLGNGNFFVATLLMAILPAFVEEFVFRGVIFGSYKKSKMLASIFLSAFLFGIMHMNFNQFLYAFALGIYMAFLVEFTGSILSSMLAHFTINFTSVLVTFALPALENAMGGEQINTMGNQTGNFLNTMEGPGVYILIIGIVIWALIALVTTAGGVGVCIAIVRISGRWEYMKQMFKQGDRKKIITIPVIIAIILTLAIMVLQVI